MNREALIRATYRVIFNLDFKNFVTVLAIVHMYVAM